MIIDASVAAKLVLSEDYSDRVLLLFSKESLIAPELINLEVVSAITKRHRVGLLPLELAKEAIAEWEDHLEKKSIVLIENIEIWEEAKTLALSIPHAFPDCLYLALAKQKKLPLITADKIFAEKAKKHYKDIVNIRDFSLH